MAASAGDGSILEPAVGLVVVAVVAVVAVSVVEVIARARSFNSVEDLIGMHNSYAHYELTRHICHFSFKKFLPTSVSRL